MYCYGTVNADIISHLSLYEMVPNGIYQYKGILLLLLYFKWRWIGIIVVDAISLEWFIQNILPDFSRLGICIAVMESFTGLYHDVESRNYKTGLMKIYKQVINSNVNMMVFCGEAHRMTIVEWLLTEMTKLAMKRMKGKGWILTSRRELKHIREQTILGNSRFLWVYILFTSFQ